MGLWRKCAADVRSGDQPRDKIKKPVQRLLLSRRQLDGVLMGEGEIGRAWRDRLHPAFALQLEFAHRRATSIVAINAEISEPTWFSRHALAWASRSA